MLNIFNQQKTEPIKIAPKKNPKRTAGNIKMYTDPTGEFDNKQLRYGIWFLKNKVAMYRTIVTLLVLVNLGLWSYSLINWAVYLITYPEHKAFEQTLGDFPDYTALNARIAAVPLQVRSTGILPGGSETYDAVSEAVNPNPKYFSFFDYYYVINGTSTQRRTTFLLPGQASLIAEFGLPSEFADASPVLKIENVRWQKISAHQMSDVILWQNNRINFAVDNFAFESEYSQPDGVKANRITFDLKNDSAFSYKAPQFYVGLYSDGGLAGIMPLELDNFWSMETRKVDLRNFVSGFLADSAVVYPLINIYDSGVYLLPPNE